jgi:hypothetical protein
MTRTTLIPTFHRLDGDDPNSDVARWLASVPDTFTAPQARDAATAALKDARNRIGEVRDKYHGTLPPAPWPAGPDLVKAQDAMEGARAFFGKIADTGVDQKWTKGSAKAWIALSRAGTDLYAQLDQLEAASANAPLLADLLKAVPDPRDLLFGRFDKKTAALVGVGLWLFVPEVKRTVRRLLRF